MRHCRDCIDLHLSRPYDCGDRVIEKYIIYLCTLYIYEIFQYINIRYVHYQIGLKFYQYSHDDRISQQYQRNFKNFL